MQRRFNLAPFTYTSPDALGEYVYRQMKLLAGAIAGAVWVDAKNSGTTKSITIPIADQTTLTLTADVTLTLVTKDMHRGQSGDIEFTQDNTGGRVVTFVNLVGTVPAISAVANKRSLVRFNHVGTGWLAQLIQAGY